eukprot:952747-Pyramimonas_sp.AAC.1
MDCLWGLLLLFCYSVVLPQQSSRPRLVNLSSGVMWPDHSENSLVNLSSGVMWSDHNENCQDTRFSRLGAFPGPQG